MWSLDDRSVTRRSSVFDEDKYQPDISGLCGFMLDELMADGDGRLDVPPIGLALGDMSDSHPDSGPFRNLFTSLLSFPLAAAPPAFKSR